MKRTIALCALLALCIVSSCFAGRETIHSQRVHSQRTTNNVRSKKTAYDAKKNLQEISGKRKWTDRNHQTMIQKELDSQNMNRNSEIILPFMVRAIQANRLRNS